MKCDYLFVDCDAEPTICIKVHEQTRYFCSDHADMVRGVHLHCTGYTETSLDGSVEPDPVTRPTEEGVPTGPVYIILTYEQDGSLYYTIAQNTMFMRGRGIDRYQVVDDLPKFVTPDQAAIYIKGLKSNEPF